MEGTRTRLERLQQDETRILARIVDAMLAAQDELEDASPNRWSRILRDSCRRQKPGTRRRRVPMASAC